MTSQEIRAVSSFPIPARINAFRRVDLNAVVHNYKAIKSRVVFSSNIASVLKCDAYSLGLERVADALMQAGERFFFVANLDEAWRIRKVSDKAEIFVLSGYVNGTAFDYLSGSFFPVLITPAQVENWLALQSQEGRVLPSVIHIDTGMNRTGIHVRDLCRIKHLIPMLQLRFVMSHYSSSEADDQTISIRQRDRFIKEVMPFFPGVPFSLANSAGTMISKCFHGHWVRPGIALTGMSSIPRSLGDNPFIPAISIYARVVQLGSIAEGETVGYNETYKASRNMSIATVGIGYGDGVLRSLSNRGFMVYKGYSLPIIGRVSMDFLTVDISSLPEGSLHEGDWLTYFEDAADVQSLADAAGSVPYEILTSTIGGRYITDYEELISPYGI